MVCAASTAQLEAVSECPQSVMLARCRAVHRLHLTVAALQLTVPPWTQPAQRIADWQSLDGVQACCARRTPPAADWRQARQHPAVICKRARRSNVRLNVDAAACPPVPRGLLPVVELDGKVLAESADIVDALEATFPEPAMLPAAGSQERRCALHSCINAMCALCTLCCMARSEHVLLGLQPGAPR